MADAIFAASFLNACIRHGDRVRKANFAPAVNARGPLFVHEDGIVKRSTYHVFEMYVWLLQTHTLPALARTRGLDADGTEVPLIDVVATGNPESGALSIALLNKSPDSASPVRLRVNGALAADSAMVTVLGAAAPDAFNDVAHPRRRAPAHQHDQNHRRPYHSRPPQTAKGSAGPLVPQARTPRGETVPEG
jgi:alpha-N-arabinofuranosidase